MANFIIPILAIFLAAWGQLDTGGLNNNTWVNVSTTSEPPTSTKDNWAYENDLKSHPFYGFFVMGPGHIVHPQDCKYYPFDPVKKTWFMTDPPRLQPRRCLSSFVINSQDTMILQLGGAESAHQQGQGAWNSSYTLIDLGGKRRGLWAYSFNRNEWYHIAGPVIGLRGISSSAFDYDPVHDLAIVPDGDSTFTYNFHSNSLRRLRTSPNFREMFYNTAVDTRRGICYLMTNNALYKFDPETEAWTAVPGTHPPCPLGAADGNGTGLNQLAYDDINDVLLYTGDDNTAGGAPNINTWIFDCATLQWTKMTPTTSPLDRGRLAYNHALNAFMLLGGTANAWISRGGSTKGVWIYRYKRGPSTLLPAPAATINTTGSQPVLAWKRVSGATGYNIYQGFPSPYPKGYVLLHSSPSTDTFFQATAGAVHAYRVCAVQNGTEGLKSRILYEKPGVLLNVTASVEDTFHVRVTWDPSPSGTATGYNIYRATGSAGFTAPFPGSYVKVNSAPVTGTAFLDSIPGGMYGFARVYVVTAVNGLGLEGGVSPECTTHPNSPERACVYAVSTPQGQRMAFHWQPPKNTKIAGVNLYHVHPDSEAQDPNLITLPCFGGEYFLQPGEPGHMSATRLNGTKTAPILITDTVTTWPMPPQPADNTGFDLQTQTYIARAVNIMGREGFGTDQISPNNNEFGNGVAPANLRFNYGAWSPLSSAVEKGVSRTPTTLVKFIVSPNPFQARLTTAFEAVEGNEAVVSLINLAGQRVASRTLNAKTGWNTAEFDLAGKPSGVYLAEVRIGRLKMTTRAILAR